MIGITCQDVKESAAFGLLAVPAPLAGSTGRSDEAVSLANALRLRFAPVSVSYEDRTIIHP
jgi:hypothetical protein